MTFGVLSSQKVSADPKLILKIYDLGNLSFIIATLDFPGGSDGKASVYNAGDPGLSPGLGRSLEKEMAIHSSTIAWKIPWTEEPGRLQAMGSQRVGHN